LSKIKIVLSTLLDGFDLHSLQLTGWRAGNDTAIFSVKALKMTLADQLLVVFVVVNEAGQMRADLAVWM